MASTHTGQARELCLSPPREGHHHPFPVWRALYGVRALSLLAATLSFTPTTCVCAVKGEANPSNYCVFFVMFRHMCAGGAVQRPGSLGHYANRARGELVLENNKQVWFPSVAG